MNKDQKPLLSICIPTYNRAELLRETLDHLAEKLDQSYEIVVSNNCSTDHTIDVLEDFAKKWDKFRYITQTNELHPGHNFAVAAMMATGQYSYTLSDDDRIVNDGISIAVKILQQHQEVAAVYGSYKEWFPDTGLEEDYIHTYEIDYYPKGSKKEIFMKYVYLWLPVVRTEICQRFAVQTYTKKSWGHWPYISKVLDHGGIMVIPDFLYKHRQTENRLEHNLTEGWFHDMYRADFEIYMGQLENGSIQNAEFIAERSVRSYVQGAKFSIGKKQWMNARNYFLRARAYGIVDDNTIKKWEESYMINLTVERIDELIRIAPGIKKIIFEYHMIVTKIIQQLKELMPDIEIIQIPKNEFINLQTGPDDFIISWDYDTLRQLEENTQRDPLRQCSLKDVFESNLIMHKKITFE